MNIITINNKQYYLSNDLKNNEQIAYYSGCGKSNSKFLDKYELDEDVDFNYFVKNKVTGTYTLTRNRTRGTILMISKDWVDAFDQLGKRKREIEPDILDLKPFHDDEGNVYDVEVRGERHYQKCYFLASDIAKCFGIKNLENSVQKTRSSRYIEGIHYLYFWRSTGHCPQERQKPNNARLFLTYKGLMAVLFSATTPAANKFIDWACELVFTAHMGTEDQKLELSATLMGLSKAQVKQYFETCTAPISGLYLIKLGLVKDLRQKFSIPTEYSDSLGVYKFGRSENIATRFQQHVRSYAKLRIYDIKLIYYCPIDSELAPKAERELRDHFEAYDMKLENDTHTEIAIFEEKGKRVKSVFEQLFKIHMSTNIALINKLRDAKNEIQVLKDKLEANEKHQISIVELYEQKRQEMEAKQQAIQELNDLKIKSLMAKIKRRDKKLARFCN